MDDIYILMLGSLLILALIDLVVGVSNDAVNFLNSAIGSKILSMRTILIAAGLGVAIGAFYSTGMMEVARSGIINPKEFYFNEIMIIFMAVMVTDVLLLDFFNTLGLPTSTTVSIVFELLGAGVAMAIIKVAVSDTETFNEISKYINSEKTIEIVVSIFLSVGLAFTLGALVQYLTRLFLTFNFEQKPKIYGALFAGTALAAITDFIFLKGVKGTAFADQLGPFFEGHEGQILLGSFLAWTALTFMLSKFFNVNIYKVIIVVGTFSLALAFAGNDLVNFIGVPMAAWHSYDLWVNSGIPASELTMGALAGKVNTPQVFLIICGLVMVATLIWSSKARKVASTEVDLARQHEGTEKFQPNDISRLIVRASVGLSYLFDKITPAGLQAKIDERFKKPSIRLSKNKIFELPAFDAVRASTNIMVSAVLIAFGTANKLPLSTTYVTFMVAMGTSLSDRAWDRESAVYRISGVLNVIGGWFVTAITAFVAAGIITYILFLGKLPALVIIILLTAGILLKNFLSHKKEEREKAAKKVIQREELITVKEVFAETSDHISSVVNRVNKLFTNVVDDLARDDVNNLKKSDKHVNKLNEEIDTLKSEAFYFIRSLDDNSVEASRFYLLVLGYLQDISQSISYITKASYKHVNNKHKNLKKSQIKELKSIDTQLSDFLTKVSDIFKNREYGEIGKLVYEKQELLNEVRDNIEAQITRIRTEESSPKNTTLFFGNLLETKDLIKAVMSLLELYQEFDLTMKKEKI